MKVALINQPWNWVPPVKGGSIAIWIYEVARRLARNCDVLVYARTAPFQKDLEGHGGVQYRRFSTSRDERLRNLLDRFSRFYDSRRPLFASRLYYAGYIRKIARDLRHQRCDIIHIHNLTQFVPAIRAHNPRAKIVLHMHSEWLTQLDQAVIQQRLRDVDLVLGCSDFITEKIRQGLPQYASRCHTVFNGVDVQRFSRNGTRPQSKVKQLLWVGRITPEKGLHLLLEAFAKVVARDPRVHLEIVGPESLTSKEFIVDFSEDARLKALARFYPGSYLAQLREQVACWGLGEHVRFVGFVPPERLGEYYRAADVLVNPSLYESFGMSLVEAMVAELPVVATHVGGMTGIVENGKTGLLVEPGDTQTLAEAILQLLGDDELRKALGQAGRECAIQRFSWERVAESLLAQYGRLCQAAA